MPAKCQDDTSAREGETALDNSNPGEAAAASTEQISDQDSSDDTDTRPDADIDHTLIVDDPDNPYSYNHTTLPESVPLRLLPTFAEMAHSDDPAVMFHGVLMVRKLLFVEENPPIQAVVDSGVVQRLVSLLLRDDQAELQLEATRAVAKLTSGTREQVRCVIQLDVVPQFVRLLESTSEEVREQAAWAIGDIAGTSAAGRDLVLSHGAMSKLIKAIGIPVSNVAVLRRAVWALSNLCRSKPPPAPEHVAPALLVLSQLLHHSDNDVGAHACWALAHISDGSHEDIQRVLQANVVPRLVQLLAARDDGAKLAALRTIGNIATGSDMQRQVVINNGALNAFFFALHHKNGEIKQEACRCLANITAGAIDQIQFVLNANLFPVLINLLHARENEVKKQALQCVANVTAGGMKEQLRYLCDIGVLESLCHMLEDPDDTIVATVLECLENVLRHGQDDMRDRGLDVNPYAALLHECGGYAKIKALQERPESEIRSAAAAIIQACVVVGDDNV